MLIFTVYWGLGLGVGGKTDSDFCNRDQLDRKNNIFHYPLIKIIHR